MGDILAVRDEYQQIQWAAVIQECKASGLTNKEYCIRQELLLLAEETSHANSGLRAGAGTAGSGLGC